MSLLAWNCRGLGNPSTVHVLVDLVHSKKPMVIFLMETFANQNRMQTLKNNVGFYGLFTVDSVGHSGGLALMWKEDSEVSVIGYSKNHINAQIRLNKNEALWRLTGYYGYLERNIRR